MPASAIVRSCWIGGLALLWSRFATSGRTVARGHVIFSLVFLDYVESELFCAARLRFQVARDLARTSTVGHKLGYLKLFTSPT